MRQLRNFINNNFVEPSNKCFIDSINPANGEVIAQIPDSDAGDVDTAVQAASSAFKSWSKTTRQQRSDILHKIADALEQRLEEFAIAESQDQGKPVTLALSVDIPRAIYNFRYFAGRILYQDDKKSDLDGVAMSYTQRVPIGVAGLISPWNLPLYLLTWKVAPCIAYGNTCVCKPSEFTSVTAYMLCEVLQQCQLPAGVVNMVFGYGHTVGQAIVTHRDIPLISFTGGTATGETIARNAAPMHKKLSLELGGKNANIVFEDADMDQCLATTIRSSFNNQGEICLCGSRILVHRSVYKQFVERFVALIKDNVIVGDPLNRSLNNGGQKLHVGAINSKQHFDKVLSYIQKAKDLNAQIVHGGHSITNIHPQGLFIEPTVVLTEPLDSQFSTLDHLSCAICQEEVFGPYVTITPFDNEEHAITLANSTKYGLSATVWTENGKRQRRVAEQLQAGTVWVNCWMTRDLNMPFGGMKQSGLGREGGDYSIDFFTELKTICLKN
ncbi:hypothetical protein MIR68_009021 [Amoeboaphelidium protococcarum]|nr:hypothetical protein MIR68_009021 [Amoeboaphelidium protococcarum]